MMDKLFLLIFCLSNFLFLSATPNQDPVVRIRQGTLKGKIGQDKNGRNFSSFLGIPYARPPVGEFRFKNPEAGLPWRGIRQATEEANICPQLEEENVKGNEDCLFINVHTPFLQFNSPIDNNKLLPVMVWFHGGGFFWGNGNPSFLGPNFLPSRNVVLVSLNYRLGIFGFLTTGNSASPGNFGLKDQVMALKWIQENIKKFGGDPNRVTIFGESSGGASVQFLALSDQTHGLFHRYIIQSGNVLGAWSFRRRENYQPYLDTISKTVNCPNTNSETFVNCLRNQSVEKLLNIFKVKNEEYPLLHWLPTNEAKSKDAFITERPEELMAQNKMRDLPFIVGSTTDEGLFLSLLYYANLTSASLTNATKNAITFNAEYYLTKDKIPKFTKAVIDYYFNGSIESLSRDELIKNYTRFLTDAGFFYPQVKLLEKMSQYAQSRFYSYLFGYRGNNSYTSLIYTVKENVGVVHSDDLLYLFSGIPLSWLTKDDEKITDLMLDLWTSFAKNSVPKSHQINNPHLWQPYKQCQAHLRIGDINNNTIPSVTLQRQFYPDAMNFWKKTLPIL
ncbi:esterase FE4-like [Leptopilina heterotoma]|uniref:esterase FE4-like n=1 Tax=Leptopilina heterotoma TaxID=63436 RepID=UPI001CA7F233|nr:esterase FE4-like [Leptopilina heterotoma]